jgi:hypothetical protein
MGGRYQEGEGAKQDEDPLGLALGLGRRRVSHRGSVSVVDPQEAQHVQGRVGHKRRVVPRHQRSDECCSSNISKDECRVGVVRVVRFIGYVPTRLECASLRPPWSVESTARRPP